jgi:hypothetical protein
VFQHGDVDDDDCSIAQKLVPELVPDRFYDDQVSPKSPKFSVGVEGIEPSASTV